MINLQLIISSPLLVTSVIFFILPLLTWVVLKGQRYRSVSYWCASGLMYGLGFFLMGLRGTVPDWVSFPVAILLIYFAALGRVQSLLYILRKPLSYSFMLLSALLFIALFEGIRLGLEDGELRILFSLSINMVFCAILGVLAWRIARLYRFSNAYLLVFVQLVLVIIISSNIIKLMSGLISPEDIMANIISLKAGAIGAIATVTANFAFIGMSLDSVISREAKLEINKFDAINKSQLVIAQLDRQRSLGAMAASLGHELNQPLTAIMTFTQMAKQGVNKGLLDAIQLNAILDEVMSNTRRANLIIEKVRGFIRPEALKKSCVPMDQLVKDAAQFIRQDAMSRNVELVFSQDKGSLIVLGDETQLSQVLLNIYRNALEAMAGQKTGKIYTAVQHVKPWIVIAVSDNGPGFSETVLENIGEPFFTTKPDGLGLGVSISKSIIEQHHGKLLMSNAKDGGALFEILLPDVDCDQCKKSDTDACPKI